VNFWHSTEGSYSSAFSQPATKVFIMPSKLRLCYSFQSRPFGGSKKGSISKCSPNICQQKIKTTTLSKERLFLFSWEDHQQCKVLKVAFFNIAEFEYREWGKRDGG